MPVFFLALAKRLALQLHHRMESLCGRTWVPTFAKTSGPICASLGSPPVPVALRRAQLKARILRFLRTAEIQRRYAVNAFLSALARPALGRCYVFMPMASRYRLRKVVKCPEFDQPAEILVESIPSPSSKPKKKLFSIRNCSLWPKTKGCTQSCER